MLGLRPSDEALYRRAREGDLVAFDQLYARHERQVFGFILRRLGDRAQAEELFHDVFVNVMAGAEPRFAEARFAAWLFRCARNACCNWQRTRFRGARAVAQLGHELPEEVNPEAQLLEEERVTSLARAVERLPPSLADVFSLRSSGLSYAEIADELGVPTGTVKSRMNTLVQKLRTEMEP